MRLFSHVSVVLTVIQNEWLATNSQNVILNNFEDNYKFHYRMCASKRSIKLCFAFFPICTHYEYTFHQLLKFAVFLSWGRGGAGASDGERGGGGGGWGKNEIEKKKTCPKIISQILICFNAMRR